MSEHDDARGVVTSAASCGDARPHGHSAREAHAALGSLGVNSSLDHGALGGAAALGVGGYGDHDAGGPTAAGSRMSEHDDARGVVTSAALCCDTRPHGHSARGARGARLVRRHFFARLRHARRLGGSRRWRLRRSRRGQRDSCRRGGIRARRRSRRRHVDGFLRRHTTSRSQRARDTPWFQSPDDHAGDIYVSFHEHGPSPDPEPGWHERMRYREDSAFFRMMRRATPRRMATGMETRPPHLRRVEVVIQARPQFPPLGLDPTINPIRWSLLWSIIRLRVPSFLIGRSVDNWIRRDLQYPDHRPRSSALGHAPNTSLLGGGIYKYLAPVGLVFHTGSTSSHWEALATRRAQLELTRIMTSIPPRTGTHASYRILGLMRHECVRCMMDRYPLSRRAPGFLQKARHCAFRLPRNLEGCWTCGCVCGCVYESAAIQRHRHGFARIAARVQHKRKGRK